MNKSHRHRDIHSQIKQTGVRHSKHINRSNRHLKHERITHRVRHSTLINKSHRQGLLTNHKNALTNHTGSHLKL